MAQNVIECVVWLSFILLHSKVKTIFLYSGVKVTYNDKVKVSRERFGGRQLNNGPPGRHGVRPYKDMLFPPLLPTYICGLDYACGSSSEVAGRLHDYPPPRDQLWGRRGRRALAVEAPSPR